VANRVVALLVVVALGIMLVPLVRDIDFHDETPELGARYVEASANEIGAANAVTAIVVSYRGLDTLGEVTVLFAATAGVGFVISRRRRRPEYAVREGRDVDSHAAITNPDAESERTQGPSEILATASRFLTPILFLFGTYIFVHGHLSPGGGFQGGVVLASAVVLGVFGAPDRRLSHGVMTALESISGASYVALALLGIALGAGFLDPSYLPVGSLGALLSAGAVPIIYSVVGIKVGTELAGVVDRLREQEHE
jgi:multicomponent Na+:H+ antiporter subunit B